jgi:N-acetylmuramate 1-kinase
LTVSDRDDLIESFLSQAGWRGAARTKLAADASFRRYERLMDGARRVILMDAPPPREDVRPFVSIQRILAALGLSVPAIFAQDFARGFLLLEDFGDGTYTRLLAAGESEPALYALAVDVLIELHRRFVPGEGSFLPHYDETRLLAEAALLVDWYLPAVRGQPTPPELRGSYLDLWRGVLPGALAVPQTLVLRDYHVDNLMRLDGRDRVAACGILDFQDAVLGPVTYDLVSLLEDARRDVPEELRRALIARYRAAFPDLEREAFAASYAILGAQRHCKVIGIFTRLCQRDGKAQYLRHIPRLWRMLEEDFGHPALAVVADWFAVHLPPALRFIPPIRSAA